MPADDPVIAGRFDGLEHRFPVRVYFEDTDLSGVVYHANYLRFMERARSDMLGLTGINQRAVFEAGEGAFAITRMKLRFAAPARLDDALIVVSRVVRVRAASVDIQQRVMRHGELLVEAEVEAAFVAPSGRLRRLPAGWADAFVPLVMMGN
jgi:acyl-CoA thioester hydrolase